MTVVLPVVSSSEGHVSRDRRFGVVSKHKSRTINTLWPTENICYTSHRFIHGTDLPSFS